MNTREIVVKMYKCVFGPLNAYEEVRHIKWYKLEVWMYMWIL